LDETNNAHQECESALLAAPDLTEVNARLNAISTEVAVGRGKLAEARARHEGLKREAEARVRRLQSIDSDRKNWISRGENAHRQILSLTVRQEEAARELSAIADGPDEIDARRRALMSELSQAEINRKAAADKLQSAENRQQELDRAATLAIQTLSESREARARAEERLVAARERRTEIEGRIREVAQVEPHEVFKLTGLNHGDAMPPIDHTEKALDRLKIERERLGAVNLRAEEEQSELTGRLELIISEREDVVEAVKTLRQAIHGLNREGRERLLAAFDVVNVQFQRLFMHLFGGGTAELQLIESDDPLEAGLEILARPPGKKPQTMTLLSGGEQALTAMALIFAVFLTNPAPICVLDEVDAPLDDHNVERFCNLMDEMARTTDTRFVIITHNPITMARMNRLFGVTMAEQGVSQLVSVDLQMAEQLREAS
jgi:chromosome segregation protein